METYDTYCLLPEGADLSGLLDSLFEIEDDVALGEEDATHHLRSGQDAAALFRAELPPGGPGIRFRRWRLGRTVGGWLYRLEDGAAVVGVSGDAALPGAHFRQLLGDAVPGGVCCTAGDQPPPDTRAEFLAWVDAAAD